ncbi:MAG TPA: hypothetical protein VLH85_07270 [Levilinea sp.]|nr:hypothetical protein [Levilinea sp.]
MVKKVKRQVSRGPRLSDAQRSSPVSAPNTSTPAPSRPALSSEFNPDYTKTIQDLKKIGIMAVSFISILVALSFFLN